MKKKIFFPVFFLILVVFLSGCGSGIPDEVEIENIINSYFSALSECNMSRAKILCVTGSDAYLETVELESFLYSLYDIGGSCDTITVNASADISGVAVIGDNAQANLYAYMEISACGFYRYGEDDRFCTLQKIGDSWRLYSFENTKNGGPYQE